MTGSTVERARGRWREILPRLGIGPEFLTNKHGPCPLCGGRDRYRFDDRDGSGSYYCNQCGAGSGIILVQKANGWTFKEAADAIDEIICTDTPLQREESAPASDEDKRRERVDAVLRGATDSHIVEDYLRSRGLSTFPDVLRGRARLPYFDDSGRKVGSFPAMLGLVHGADGSLQSVHRTYIADVSPRKKLMPAIGGEGALRGAAVRLFEPADVLGVAEGIETSIAAHELHDVPVWATISSAFMEAWSPPARVRRVVVFGDNDANFAGQKAALSLANRLVREGYAVDVKIPPEADTDWLDVLARA